MKYFRHLLVDYKTIICRSQTFVNNYLLIFSTFCAILIYMKGGVKN